MDIINFAGTLVINEDKVLLVQEAHKEAYGLWSLPLGHVEVGEKISDTALRETKEETGYNVELGKSKTLEIDGADLKSTKDFDACKIRLTIFEGHVTKGEMLVGIDVLNVGWFSMKEITYLPLRGSWIKEFLKNSLFSS